MADQKKSDDRSRIERKDSSRFDFRYEPVADVDPLELVGNASLSLHHHMAPSDGGFDLEFDDE